MMRAGVSANPAAHAAPGCSLWRGTGRYSTAAGCEDTGCGYSAIISSTSRLAADIGADQRLVVDLGDRLLLDHLDQRRRRKIAQLRIDRPEHRIGRHHDLVDGESDERPAGHGVMRHEDGCLGLTAADRAGDLQRGKHETARRMQPSE
jgi:hypothetical protein